ncbi:MAG: universal stress protein [Chloroflexi bacterium]|nr:universal stress protein [Chloroflexota bacterium]MCH8108785.1 universal stress protein [Chloroflexota bacterium]
MYKQILVPLDGSELAEQVLPHAQGLAKTYEATIHILRAFTHDHDGLMGLHSKVEIGLTTETSFDLQRQYGEAQKTTITEYIEHVRDRIKNEGIDVKVEALEGSAYDQIVDYAKKHDIDLIAMTTHGHGGLRRMLTGSVTDRVIRGSEIPVLVIHCH